MSHPNPERDERDECLVSTHEFKLHDWRWLAWPLSNTFARGRWCRLCGLVQGEPEGQCQTEGCLEYAAGDNDFCKFCQHRWTLNNAATAMRDRCVAKVKDALLDHAVGCGNALYCDCGTEANRQFLIELLESLTLEQGEQEKR